MFCIQMMSWRQAVVPERYFKNLKKHTCESNYARHMLKELLTSISVNSLDVYPAASRLGKYS